MFVAYAAKRRFAPFSSLSKYFARDNSKMFCKELGKYFGEISWAGISMRYNKAYSELAENRKLRNKVRAIKDRIMNN